MDTMRDISNEAGRLSTAYERVIEVRHELLRAERRVVGWEHEAEIAREQFEEAMSDWIEACYERGREADEEAEHRDRLADAGVNLCSHTTSDGGTCQACAGADDMPF